MPGYLSSDGRHLITQLVGDQSTTTNLTNPSIYVRLQDYLHQSTIGLDPSPILNSIFSDLVSYLQGSPSIVNLPTNGSFSTVAREVCHVLDTDQKLRARSSTIRELAIRAESRMELYYVQVLLAAGKRRMTGMSGVEKVHMASRCFPYIDNYVTMVKTEAKVIQKFMDKKCIGSRNMNIAFCGSGPLPFTGILLALYMEVNVTLIDCDAEAVELSTRLIDAWEKNGIIPKGQVSIICANGADVAFNESVAGKESVWCDVLFVAALIPNDVKEVMIRNVCRARENGPLVVLRTAHGLTARFAYFKTKRKTISKYMEFMALVAPRVHEMEGGFIIDDAVRPLEFFTSDILNSLEVYRWNSQYA